MPSREQETVLRPSAVWKQLPKERRQLVARAFWTDDESIDQQVEAIELIARQMKFRPRSVQALDLDRKARYLASMPQPSEALAARVLIAYHLQAQRPMMGAFLDALGIAHDNGLIADEDAAAPEAEKLTAVASELLEKFPREDVQLYFSTLLSQDPETWGGLAELPVIKDKDAVRPA